MFSHVKLSLSFLNLSEQPTECCKSSVNETRPSSCFESLPNIGGEEYCVDPLLVFDSSRTAQKSSSWSSSSPRARCGPMDPCLDMPSGVCVRPRSDQSLFSMRYVKPSNRDDGILVWRGPASEIWEQGMSLAASESFESRLRDTVVYAFVVTSRRWRLEAEDFSISLRSSRAR